MLHPQALGIEIHGSRDRATREDDVVQCLDHTRSSHHKNEACDRIIKRRWLTLIGVAMTHVLAAAKCVLT